MREMLSLRSVHVRALLGFIVISTSVEYTQKEAHADDTTSVVVAAPPKKTFGERGEVVLPIAGVAFGTGLGALGGYSVGPVALNYSSSPDSQGGRDTSTSVSFDPSLDFFVARHFSIGGSLVVGYSNFAYTPPANADPNNSTAASSQGQITVGLLPRIGYAIPISEHFSIWPRVGGGIVAVDNTGSNPGPPMMPFELRGDVDLSLIYHVDKTFFVSVAPGLFLGGAPKTTDAQSELNVNFGTSVTLGFVL